MNYEQFQKQFDNLLLKKETDYHAAADYLRSRYFKHLSSTFHSIIARLERFILREDSYWCQFNDVITDIANVLEIRPGEIVNLEAPILDEEAKDFQTIKEKLYDTTYYPVSEHLNYIDFANALERQTYIAEQIQKLDVADARFCDLGCGPGVLLAFVLQNKPSWIGYGVDISFQCAQYAQRLLELKGVATRVHFDVADVRHLPYPDAFFDFIIGMEIFEHLPNPKVGLQEALRVLKPGGYAVLGLPIQLPIRMHLYVFSDREEILALYDEVGLQIIDFKEKEFALRRGSFVDTFALGRKIARSSC